MVETQAPPDPAELLGTAERELLELAVEAQRADWVYATHVSEDTEAISALATSRYSAAAVRFAHAAVALPADSLSADQRRKVRLLRLGLTLATPAEGELGRELVGLVRSMEAVYAKGRHVPLGAQEPVDLQALSRILYESRDPAALEDAWTGWHRVGRPMRRSFERYVELANRGARELGFADTAEMWMSKYDMAPEEFRREVERLWGQVRPLYESLRTFFRRKLISQYGHARIPESGPLPAQYLGDMWSQSWEGIYPLSGFAVPGSSTLTDLLRAREVSPEEMFRYGERFFLSLGFAPLPRTFWERSMISRPRDREVVCHASAWDIDLVDDLRVKMCTERSEEDFQTIHHELGHNFYQRACSAQPFLYRDGAHDGFHEAIGDVLALSVTPDYLLQVGLGDGATAPGAELAFLFRRACEKIPFLPFSVAVEEWRWNVFRGAVGPAEYNRSWWATREMFQGIRPPHPRDEEEFDPGAKYHIAASVPYIRYFLAYILQFQIHRALLRTAGYSGPMHLGSIYGSGEAGARLRAMMELGASREWPEALEVVTGERRMDASALLEYFAPIRRWLDEENRRAG